MKNQAFHKRASYALAGWRNAFATESSFRTQIVAALGAVGATAIFAPSLIWWALIVLSIALVLAAELFNTALEHTLDGLHPKQAEFVRQAKDCAAGAVLIFSCASVIIFVLMVLDSGRFV
jgi:diacylglycerol kinase